MSAQAADNIRSLTDRDQRGRFASVPGNVGRPYGAKGKQSREHYQKLKELIPRAFEALEIALTRGDRHAYEFILNRTLPQSRLVEFEGTTAADVSAAMEQGQISTAEAKDMSATLAKLSEISELNELRQRLAELEKLLHQQAR